jgi:tRNA(Arg) A34 adenosine deaminase TadA
MTDKEYMQIAIDISKKAKYPYGAIIVKDNKIIGRSDSQTIVSKTIYEHAELIAIEDASKDKLYGALKGATMYASCESCIMCMGAILYEEIDKLYFAATLEDSSKYVTKEIEVSIQKIKELANSNIEIVSEFMRNEALQVLKEYGGK